jgi:hypothetical protein
MAWVTFTAATDDPPLKLQVPRSWLPFQAGVGDTGGTEWVNPADHTQRIAVVSTGCLTCMTDSAGDWSVQRLYAGDAGVQWTSLAVDQLHGSFTDTDHTDEFCLNGDIHNLARGQTHEPYIALGYAAITKIPTAQAIEVFAWAPTDIAQRIIASAEE